MFVAVMGRSRVSPEDTHSQSPSSMNCSPSSTGEQSDTNCSISSSIQTHLPPRTIKIRFLDDLSPSEQEKYQVEQLKKQVEKRAALASSDQALDRPPQSDRPPQTTPSDAAQTRHVPSETRVTENPLANQVEQQTQNQVPYQGGQKTQNQVPYQGGTQVPYQGGINLSNTTTGQFNPNSETSVDHVLTRSSNYSQRDSAHNNQSVNHAGHDRTNQPRQYSVYPSSAHKDLERVEGVPTDRNHDTNYASHHSLLRRHQLAHDKNQWYYRNGTDITTTKEIREQLGRSEYNSTAQFNGLENPVFRTDGPDDRYDRWRTDRAGAGRHTEHHSWRRFTVAQQIRYGIIQSGNQETLAVSDSVYISGSEGYMAGVDPENLDLSQTQHQPPGEDENSNYDYSNVPMAGLPMIGALMGMCLGGPIGFLAGVKIGGLAAVGGSILGYTGASVVSEHKELRDYMDEHYQNKPELYVQSPREEARQRRFSRQLPEIPRPLGSAASKNGPNGYRRPSVVRLSSQDKFVIRPTVPEQRFIQRQSSTEQTHRMLPQRPPPMLRGNSTEARSLRSSPVAQRRISYQRSSSTAMRRLPRQGSTEVHRVLPNPRTFRRYGEQSDSERQSLMALVDEYQSAERRIPQQPLQETPVSKGEKRVRWGRATFQRSTSLETPPVDFSRQRLMLVRQDSVAGSSSLPDKLEERSSDNSYK